MPSYKKLADGCTIKKRKKNIIQEEKNEENGESNIKSIRAKTKIIKSNTTESSNILEGKIAEEPKFNLPLNVNDTSYTQSENLRRSSRINNNLNNLNKLSRLSR